MRFEAGDRVQLVRPAVGLPAGAKGTVIRRYLRTPGSPEYIVRFDHDKPWNKDLDIPGFLLEKE